MRVVSPVAPAETPVSCGSTPAELTTPGWFFSKQRGMSGSPRQSQRPVSPWHSPSVRRRGPSRTRKTMAMDNALGAMRPVRSVEPDASPANKKTPPRAVPSASGASGEPCWSSRVRKPGCKALTTKRSTSSRPARGCNPFADRKASRRRSILVLTAGRSLLGVNAGSGICCAADSALRALVSPEAQPCCQSSDWSDAISHYRR